MLTNLKEFSDELRIICGREFGNLFDFERTGKYPVFTAPELITQELAAEIEIASLQDNIDDLDPDDVFRQELMVALQIIRAKQDGSSRTWPT